jgi:hypothetical protein
VRLWTLHPQYLDARGLVALWRESLLAQKVLAGRTRGYRHHPQLERFRARPDPRAAIAAYLVEIHAEGQRRHYRFDARRIGRKRTTALLRETRGQLQYEREHLLAKLKRRAPRNYRALCVVTFPRAHPLFRIVRGPVRSWERAPAAARSSGRAA